MKSLSAGSLSHGHRHRLFLLLRLRLRLPLSTASHSTSASFSPPLSNFQRRSDEESRAVRVSVWWDFENCSLPTTVNVFKVAHCITSAVRVSGIKGPVQITAFGDVFQLARSNQEALSATGITLTHVPRGGKNSADRSLLVDLMYWVSQNPPPAHLFLISGDRDFAGTLHRLRMSNYNILLACTETAPSVLCSAASITWQWNELVKGEIFTGKHFNQPPDGPYNSWYGHYKGVLEDPFAQPPARSQSDGSDSELASGTKVVPGVRLRPVPRDVLRKISKIVSTFPQGIPISVLGSHMTSGKEAMDKKWYGHKNFSQFLLSKPNIVKLKHGPDGQFLVLPAFRHQASKPVDYSTDGETEDSSVTTKQKAEHSLQEAEKAASFSDGENHASDASILSKEAKRPESISDGESHNLAASKISKADANSVTTKEDEKSSLSSFVNINEKEMKKDMIVDTKGRIDQGKEGYKPLSEELSSRKASGANEIENHIAPAENKDSETELGYLQKLWTKWFKGKETGSDVKTDGNPDKFQASIHQPSNFIESHGAPDSHQSADNKVTSDAKDDAKNVDPADKANHSPSFFTKIFSWFKLSRKDSDDNISNESAEKSSQLEMSKRDALLLMDSFWRDVESFLNTYKGSKVIWSSKTREEIAQNLRKEGPLVIQPLQESDLLHLIDLLISEKKWIEEHPSSISPFRVVQPTRDNSEAAQINNSGRLRSIILGPFQSDKLPEQQDEDKISFDTTTKACWKAKDEVLADCRELLGDMFKESPKAAINIGHFKAKFIQRYGYTLDYRKLGYPKLASLLKTIPEVRVGLSFVYPTNTVPKEPVPKEFIHLEDELTSVDLRKPKNEENDSPWEELGPVDSSAPSRKNMNPSPKVEYNYESPLSEDDDMSDSEEEVALSSPKEEEHSKMRFNKDDSSLLQLLDSWDKEEDNKRRSSHKTIDSYQCETVLSKQRPGKSYSFVVDPDEGNKDRLIDGILANMKKSGEQRIPN